MPVIQKLDPHVADLIAAGEVVERPASVVKELMENAIDAGAGSVTVELRGGGMAMLRVTDDGCGMAPEDARTAFLRHATSKLKREEDLAAIGTLGFRGEALAAIAAVSRVELLTCRKEDAEGTRLILEGGEVITHEPAGCPTGTVITVRDLFFNTPARLKFMKNDRTEGMNAASAALRVAMSHPEISVRFIREGKEEFHTPGDGRMDSCVYTLLGREAAGQLLPAESNDGEIAVTGYVSTPAGCGGNRGKQFFFVNGRNVRSRMLQAALEQAYRNALLPGRFPACVLYMTLHPAAVDVNVHPAKTEVRFVKEKQAFDAVYYAALAALADEQGNAQIPLSKSTKAVLSRPVETETPAVQSRISAPVSYRPAPAPEVHRAAPSGNFFKTMTADTFRAEAPSPKVSKWTYPSESAGLQVKNDAYVPYQSAIDLPAEKPVPKTAESAAVQETADEPAAEEFRIIGETMETYILVEKGETLLLIDKHAAHERMIFDRLKAQIRDDAPQMLLEPEVVDVGEEDVLLLEEQTALLEEYGFDVSPFGMSSVAVRKLPSYLTKNGAKNVILDLCTELRKGGSPEALRDELLHSMACRSAIKAGGMEEREQLRVIAEAVVTGKVKYCPHGRPVAMEITKTALAKHFRRA